MVAQAHEGSSNCTSYPRPVPAPKLSSFYGAMGSTSIDNLDEIFPAVLITPTKKSPAVPSSPTSITASFSSPSSTMSSTISMEQEVYASLDDDEKMELALLLSEQEFLYGINMLEALSEREYKDAKRIAILQGLHNYKALQVVFNNKMGPVDRSFSPSLSSSSTDSTSSASSMKKVRFSDCTVDRVRTIPKKSKTRQLLDPINSVDSSKAPEVNPEDEVASWAVEMQRLALVSFEEQKKLNHALSRTHSEENIHITHPSRNLHRCMSDGFQHQPSFQRNFYSHF